MGFWFKLTVDYGRGRGDEHFDISLRVIGALPLLKAISRATEVVFLVELVRERNLCV